MRILIVLMAMLIGWTPAVAQLTNTLVVQVDCDSGDKVQPQLDASSHDTALEFVLSGTCREAIIVQRDGVILRGNAPPARTVIVGSIDVADARKVFLSDLLLRRSPASGVTVRDGAFATLHNVVSIYHGASALNVYRNAAATVDRSVFIGDNDRDTVHVNTGAALDLTRTRITAKATGVALGIHGAGSVRMELNTRLIHESPSASNERVGAALLLDGGASANFLESRVASSVTGNIVIAGAGSGSFSTAGFAGNLLVDETAMLALAGDVALTGDVRVGSQALLDYNGAGQTGSANCFDNGAVKSVPAGVSTGASCVVY